MKLTNTFSSTPGHLIQQKTNKRLIQSYSLKIFNAISNNRNLTPSDYEAFFNCYLVAMGVRPGAFANKCHDELRQILINPVFQAQMGIDIEEMMREENKQTTSFLVYKRKMGGGMNKLQNKLSMIRKYYSVKGKTLNLHEIDQYHEAMRYMMGYPCRRGFPCAGNTGYIFQVETFWSKIKIPLFSFCCASDENGQRHGERIKFEIERALKLSQSPSTLMFGIKNVVLTKMSFPAKQVEYNKTGLRNVYTRA